MENSPVNGSLINQENDAETPPAESVFACGSTILWGISSQTSNSGWGTQPLSSTNFGKAKWGHSHPRKKSLPREKSSLGTQDPSSDSCHAATANLMSNISGKKSFLGTQSSLLPASAVTFECNSSGKKISWGNL